MSLAENLKIARRQKGYKQEELAALLNKSKSVISNWERGENKPDADALFELCDILDVDANYLLGWVDNGFSITPSEKAHIKKYRSLDGRGKNVVDKVLELEYEQVQESYQLKEASYTQLRYYETGQPSAGLGNYLPESIEASTIMVHDSPLASKADFVLKVDGNSMSPKYQDGDLVLVKSQDDVDLDEIGIFVVDGEAFIKQRKQDRLHSLNPAYPDVLLSEEASVKCFGKVLGKA